MRIHSRLSLIIPALFVLTSCAGLQETAKVVWGSSTRALEKARDAAVTKEFQCQPEQCFDAIVAFVNAQQKQPAATVKTPVVNAKEAGYVSADEQHEKALINPNKTLQVFLKDKRRNLIVLIGVPGSIDTTEVGVFFVAAGEGVTKIEISSLSKYAKARVSEILFPELAKTFSAVEPTAPVSSLEIAPGSTTSPQTLNP